MMVIRRSHTDAESANREQLRRPRIDVRAHLLRRRRVDEVPIVHATRVLEACAVAALAQLVAAAAVLRDEDEERPPSPYPPGPVLK